MFVICHIKYGPNVKYVVEALNHLFGLAATYYPKSWGQVQNIS